MIEMNRDNAERHLQKVFGLQHFYDEQWRAISRILLGERVLMIQRTGFGKSLCYQFPASLFDGVTVIFSPLIALMRDQVKALRRRGIAADYINSEQDDEVNRQVIAQALKGKIKILYIAPERQENREWIMATRNMKLSMVVIDEAHTISTWGHDFRPAFRRIIDLVRLLPAHMPILAATATATAKVQHDIEQQIGGTLTTIRGSLVRPNFSLHVIRVKSEDEKMLWLAENVANLPGTGLIYTGTRVAVETYAKWLRYAGVNAMDYHAGHDAETRKDTENGLMENRWKCVVSTNALGMGLDKADIRFLIHTQIPVSPIHYYQEIGRAGRDGLPTEIILFFNEHYDNEAQCYEDCKLPRNFIEGGRPAIAKYQKVIELLKETPLREREIVKRANLKSNQVRTIKADLIEQGIIKEVLYKNVKTYEYQFGAPQLDTKRFETLRQSKLSDLEQMVNYIFTSKPRMQFLCEFLDSREQMSYSNCDNTNLPKIDVSPSYNTISRLQEFQTNNFPILETAETTSANVKLDDDSATRLEVCMPYPGCIVIKKNGELLSGNDGNLPYDKLNDLERLKLASLIERHRSSKSRLIQGYAAAYYGVSSVGAALHRSKYEGGGDFPDFLLTMMLRMIYKKFRNLRLDMVLYVPPTVSGNLVQHFAGRLANALNIPLSHALGKTRDTKEQKIFQNTYSKRDNVEGAFELKGESVRGKSILLVDDIYDSGATIMEIGRYLTCQGAEYIVPVVIAKTIGGTL